MFKSVYISSSYICTYVICIVYMHIYLFILNIIIAITLEIYIYDVIISAFLKVYYYY